MGDNCFFCGKEVANYKPEYCCSGTDEGVPSCGCRGLPINPCICNDECWNNLLEYGNIETMSKKTKSDFHGWQRTDKNYAIHIGKLPGRKQIALYMLIKDSKSARSYPLAYFKGLAEAEEATKVLDELIEPRKFEEK